MKSIKRFLFIFLAIAFILSACTIEKRVHRSGYHIDWKNDYHFLNKHKSAERSKDKQTIQNQVVALGPSESETDTVATSPAVINENITVSTHNEVIILQNGERHDLYSIDETKDGYQELIITDSINTELKKGRTSNPENAEEETKTSGMAIAGFICGIVGLILMVLTGWPFLLGTLGIIFSAIGLGQTSKGKKGKGLAIAGLIAGILAILLFWFYAIYLLLFGLY